VTLNGHVFFHTLQEHVPKPNPARPPH